MLLGALEGGGTKMVCAIGEENGNIIDRITIPTLTPMETMPQIIEYFKKHMICALGVASFGPVDLNKKSKTYGYITSSTKEEWKYYNILGTLKDALKVPCGFDTDVNGSALGEIAYGSMRRVKNGIYITVGTGIGIGVYANGALVHGMMHPEGGHIYVKRHPHDSFSGICPYHGDCLEGLAAGPAIEARSGRKGQELAPDDEIWEFVSYYIAQAICNYICTISPEKIVLGGGVMNQPQLLPMIRRDVARLMNDYIEMEQMKDLDHYIVHSTLNDNQAVLGCLKLAYNEAVVS